MAHRTKEGQKVHDQKVAELARNLEKRGYWVQADLPGHPRPPVLNGKIPDVFARKGGKILVREVETRATLKADKGQQRSLQNWAERNDAEFRVILAKRRQ